MRCVAIHHNKSMDIGGRIVTDRNVTQKKKRIRVGGPLRMDMTYSALY